MPTRKSHSLNVKLRISTMANDYIFGPFETTHPKYSDALGYANYWLSKSKNTQIETGQTVTISRGEMAPEVEKTFIEKQEKPKQEKRKKGRKSNYGRWEILNNFIDQAQTEFTPAQRAVWVTMFRMADGNSNKLYTSVRWLAKITGTSDTTVQGAITKLIKKGWLVRLFKGPTKGVPSLFKVQDGTQ